MNIRNIFSAVLLLFSSFAIASGNSVGYLSEDRPTYTKDIAPILKDRCVECHRPGEVAPMTFDSYQNVRPWAKSILKVVENKEMPPWFADPAHGDFSNANVLTEEEKSTIKKWVISGSPRGGGEEPDMVSGFTNGWEIGEPDQIFKMPEPFVVPASGTVEYTYFRVPTGFKEDKWLKAAEARPGNRSVVHHIIAFVTKSNFKSEGDAATDLGRTRDSRTGSMLAGYAPGLRPYELDDDTGIFVPAGSDIIFQMHYTASGVETEDQSMVGVVFRDSPPKFKAEIDAIMNIAFRIPAGAESHPVRATKRFKEDTKIISFMPHMHLRGKSFKYTLERRDGTKEVLLSVPRYDFEWQLHYDLTHPVVVKKGDRIVCEATFDNSSNNPDNPDPGIVVKWGDQSWEEMMIGWYTKIEANPEMDYEMIQTTNIDNLVREQRALMEKL